MDGVAGFLVEKVLPAAASGIGGVVVGALRFKKSITDRILILEQKLPQLEQKLTVVEQGPTKAESGDAKLTTRIDALEKKLQIDIGKNSKADQRLENRVVAIETRLSVLEAVNNKLNNDVHEFMKEQQDQWARINRTLGQLEGAARKMGSGTSGQFPGTKG
jgi:hypothetical protein